MPAIIEATGLTKRFGRSVALDALDLTAPEGQVTALLGPNGAGKTTFVRAVATLLTPDTGQLRVAGHDVSRDPAAVRRLIGLAGQSAAVEPTMTARENLEMVARLYGQSRRDAKAGANHLLDVLDLTEAADRRVRTFSGGMRRRLDLGASLVGKPRLLLLDEPTTGLDPRSRSQLWTTIRELVAAGTDVLLTTQYLDEADHLADGVVIVDHGRVVASGTPTELKRRVGADVVDIHVREIDDVARAAEAVARIGGDVATDPETRRLNVAIDDGPAGLVRAVSALGSARVEVDDIALRRPTLDEVFLALTGHARRTT